MKPLQVIACGALAHELTALQRANGWSGVQVQCLPAELHNRPERIPEAVRQAIRAARPQVRALFVAYGDCGTGGALDRVLAEEGVERLPGAHCYAFYAGPERFDALAAAEPGTFYLTDFLARHFERLVMRELGLRAHPELRDLYFGHYRRVLWLTQTGDSALATRARAAAEALGLEFAQLHTGLGALETRVLRFVSQPPPVSTTQESLSWPS
ncbi:DUF1638 domain-containing protein [Natronospirillum operosum]|uniref:DUF1638 domain-containing protein n=1 Tax=Natronospirillum operosum TaxID=2759953 RepID=A0A4Z0W9Z8_9GAMM|nr:DUF1638 domain-containing protein [Natronospirillum operosum]TGG94019.1 DUF1638 domain-containing protein [Natronospirillum operosum]